MSVPRGLNPERASDRNATAIVAVERVAMPSIGRHRHDIGVTHQQEGRRLRITSLDARYEVFATRCRAVPLEVETGVAQVLREDVGAARLESGLDGAIVHARVANEVREQVDSL